MILDMIINQKSNIYICGGVSMGNEVLKVLQEILNTHCNKEKESKEILSQLDKEKRIITELWG